MILIEKLKEAILIRKRVRIYKKKKYQKVPDDPKRCCKCNMIMGEDDKYCEYCGAQRGKGAFFPYENRVAYLYGPPHKRKYKCEKCGHLWIDQLVGNGEAKYCPNCKAKAIHKKMEVSFWEPHWHGFAMKEPFEEENRPLLLTEDEIMRLLRVRPYVTYSKQTRRATLGDRDVFEAMKKAGFDLPKELYNPELKERLYPITEKEDEQFLLAAKIIKSKGDNIRSFHEICCPHCRNNMIAAISYTVLGNNFKTVEEDFHVPTLPDALLWHATDRIVINSNETHKAFSNKTYLCLSCGNQFGDFSIDLVDELQKQADAIASDSE